MDSCAEAPAEPLFHVGVSAHFGLSKGIPLRNLAMMKAAGITSLRDELSWASVEQRRGEYLVPQDKSVTMHQAVEQGIAPMLIFDYANRLYDDGDRPRSRAALNGYAEYAETLLRHFGDKIRFYEVWNEYDIGIGMSDPHRKGGSPEDYVAMLAHVNPQLKKLDANVQLICGASTSGGIRNGWLEKSLKLGMLDYCDLLSIHTYNYRASTRQRTPEAWYEWMIEVQDMAKTYSEGISVPTFVTEMGWPTHIGNAYSTPPELSASYLGRLYLLARTLPFMKGVWWYDFQDDGWENRHDKHNFGLIRPDLTPKPAYYVMTDVSELAARGEFIGRVELDDPLLWVLKFRLDGQHIWAAWSADNRPRRLLLETDAHEKMLVVHKLGHPPIKRGWGHRPWATKGRRAALVDNQMTIVVGDRPWLLHGGMDNARLLQVTGEFGRSAKP